MKKTIGKLIYVATVFTIAMTQVSFASTYPEFCSVFNRTLQTGDVGQDVKRLQVVLGQEGIAYLSSTGYYGPSTAAAVKVFQQRNGIYPVGKVGPQTFRFMKNLWCFGDGGINTTNPYYPNSGIVLPSSGWNNGGNNWNETSVPEVSLQPVSSSGNNVSISWNTRAVNSCTISKDNEFPQNVGTTGQQNFTLYGESRFTLKCLGFNGREYSKQIIVRPNQAISNLPWVNVSISPAQVLVGQQATLYWTSQNTSYCTSNIAGYNSNLQSNGSVPVSVTSGTNSFTVTCYNYSGQSVSQTITANPSQSQTVAPIINNFTYSNNYLAWGTSNANSCTLSGGSLSSQTVQPNGNQYVPTPTVNTTWTLSCYGNNGQNVNRQTNYSIYTTGNPTTNVNSNLTVTVTTDKTSYNVGEAITFTIKVLNNSTANISYNEPICNPFYSFMVNGMSVFTTPQVQCLAIGSNLITLVPGQTKTYTLTVPAGYSNITNTSGNKTVNFRFYPTSTISTMGTIDINQIVNINVTGTNNNLIPTVTLTPSSQSVMSGQPAYITITSSNVTSCTIGGGVNVGGGAYQTSQMSGQIVVYPVASTNYIANCVGTNGQSVSATAYVAVTAYNNTGNITASIYANPTNTTYANQPVVLTWSSTNASYCNITGGNTNLTNQPTSGSTTVYPTVNSSYYATCYNSSNQSVQSNVAYVTVTGGNTGAVTVNISASPNPVSQGQLTSLSWYSSNANYCNIIGGNTNLANQPVNGSYAVSPSQSTNYTITCYNNNGQNASAYVYVTTSSNSSTNSNTSLFITSNQNRNVNINVYKAPYNNCNPGYINWGYNTSNTNYTYPNVTSGSACQIGVTHTYANPGTYTITAYENNVQVASTQITVQ